jgi:hypothetical protein
VMDGAKPTKKQDNSRQPINVQWNSPSCSTWSGENVGFGITASERREAMSGGSRGTSAITE